VKIITRFIQNQIKKDFFKGKVMIIYGARQVGKTTLVHQILDDSPEKTIYYNCDEPDIRTMLMDRTSTELQSLIGNAQIVIFDEAQRVKNIGLTLKLLIDTFPEIQYIATGSSSFDLANSINEPLTGRNYTYTLYPLSELELLENSDAITTKRLLETRLRFGSYPEIIATADLDEKERLLIQLKRDYMIKDILTFERIQGAETLYKLLQVLALQIGQEVSYNELANTVGIDKNTVSRYIDLLQKAFIIFTLGAFSRNLRKEIANGKKIYFYDLGLRNILINNINPPSLRSDIGHIWENYIIAERLKRNMYTRDYRNLYFWRTYDQQEIDLIEEKGGKLHAVEIKYQHKITRAPKAFVQAYPKSSYRCIDRTNYLDFITV